MKKLSFILSAVATLTLFSGCNAQKGDSNSYNISESAQNIQNELAWASDNRFADYDFNNVPENIQLNEAPDMSVKEEPPCYKFAEFDEPTAVTDIVSSGSKLVVGVPVGVSSYNFSITGTNEGDSKISDLTNGNIFTNGYVTTIKVLYSPNNDFAVGDEIRIFSAGTGWGEILDQDKEYLLSFDEWEDVYKYSCGMDSIFEIGSDFRVTSRSVFEATSKLDSLSLAEAVTFLKSAIEEKQTLI